MTQIPMNNRRITPPESDDLRLLTLAGRTSASQPGRRATGRRAPWLTLGASAMLVVVAACGGGDGPTAPGTPNTPPPPATPVGFYALNTVDAKPLPWTMYADTGYTLQVQSGTLDITANGRWVAKTVTRETVVGIVSIYNDSTFGTWTIPVGAKTAVMTNAETNTASSVSWTATEATIVQVDGATTRTIVYRKN